MTFRHKLDPNYKATRKTKVGECIAHIVHRESFNRRDVAIVYSKIVLTTKEGDEIRQIELAHEGGRINDTTIEEAIEATKAMARANRYTLRQAIANITFPHDGKEIRFDVDLKTNRTYKTTFNHETSKWERENAWTVPKALETAS